MEVAASKGAAFMRADLVVSTVADFAEADFADAGSASSGHMPTVTIPTFMAVTTTAAAIWSPGESRQATAGAAVA
jgi:hypothetical protein